MKTIQSKLPDSNQVRVFEIKDKIPNGPVRGTECGHS